MDNQELKFLVIQSQTSALNYLDSNDWNDYTSDELAELNGLITEKIKELEIEKNNLYGLDHTKHIIKDNEIAYQKNLIKIINNEIDRRFIEAWNKRTPEDMKKLKEKLRRTLNG
jgi:hypothetical protein